jgi:hypothetical protein
MNSNEFEINQIIQSTSSAFLNNAEFIHVYSNFVLLIHVNSCKFKRHRPHPFCPATLVPATDGEFTGLKNAAVMEYQ